MLTMSAGAEEQVRAALEAACEEVGLDAGGATFVQHSTHTVYHLPTGVTVRLRPGAVTPEASRSIEVIQWLAGAGAPVTALADVPQLVTAGGYVATFWERAEEPDAVWRYQHLGTALRRLHDIEPKPDLHQWWPLQTLRRRSTQLGWLRWGDRRWLRRQIDRLEGDYRDLQPTLRHGLIHGDAHLANVLRGERGPVLCDLDSIAYGPLLQDLVPTAVDAARFGTRRRQAAMVTTYGLDVTTHEAWPVLRELRELATTTFGLVSAHGRPDVQASALHRLRTLQTGDTEARWESFRQAAP